MSKTEGHGRGLYRRGHGCVCVRAVPAGQRGRTPMFARTCWRERLNDKKIRNLGERGKVGGRGTESVNGIKK